MIAAYVALLVSFTIATWKLRGQWDDYRDKHSFSKNKALATHVFNSEKLGTCYAQIEANDMESYTVCFWDDNDVFHSDNYYVEIDRIKTIEQHWQDTQDEEVQLLEDKFEDLQGEQKFSVGDWVECQVKGFSAMTYGDRAQVVDTKMFNGAQQIKIRTLSGTRWYSVRNFMPTTEGVVLGGTESDISKEISAIRKRHADNLAKSRERLAQINYRGH